MTPEDWFRYEIGVRSLSGELSIWRVPFLSEVISVPVWREDGLVLEDITRTGERDDAGRPIYAKAS